MSAREMYEAILLAGRAKSIELGEDTPEVLAWYEQKLANLRSGNYVEIKSDNGSMSIFGAAPLVEMLAELLEVDGDASQEGKPDAIH